MIDFEQIDKKGEEIAREIRITAAPVSFSVGHSILIKKEGSVGLRLRNDFADDGVVNLRDLPLVGSVLYHYGRLVVRDENEKVVDAMAETVKKKQK
jgi:hypothetical protein